MKILLVCFEFPPLGGGGVQRSMAFSKYLPQFGITPITVTTDLDSFKIQMENHPIDESHLERLHQDLIVERVSCPGRFKHTLGKFGTWRSIFFSLVEQQAKCWRPELDRDLPQLIEKYRPEAIYVSLPPFGMGPLWVEISQKYSLPLIVDFRDAWSQWRVSPYGSWFHYALTLLLERRCLKAAAHVICSSDQIRADLLKLHQGVAPEKLVTITNGYDVDVIDWSINRGQDGGKFIIGYVGNFYYSPKARDSMMTPWWRKRPNRMIQYAPRKEDWLYRSPYFFFRAVKALLDEHPVLKDRLRIRFAGSKPDWIDEQVNFFELAEIVEFVGYLDHESVIQFQTECDALLVTSSKVIGGCDYSIAGKTFEYFTMKKPIIGFVTEGAQKKILEQSGMAIVCDPDDVNTSVVQLLKLIRRESVLTPNNDFLDSLHRKNLTQRLAEVLHEIVPGH